LVGDFKAFLAQFVDIDSACLIAQKLVLLFHRPLHSRKSEEAREREGGMKGWREEKRE